MPAAAILTRRPSASIVFREFFATASAAVMASFALALLSWPCCSFGSTPKLSATMFSRAAAQIPANYWIYFYIAWFAPFLFISLFEEYRDLGPRDQDSVTSDFVKPLMISQPSSVTATRSSIRTPSTPGR